MVVIKSWERYKHHLYNDDELGLLLDISRMNFSDQFFSEMTKDMEKVYGEMELLEKGGLANPDEGRMVGHYWLRYPDLAPSVEISKGIQDNIADILRFAEQIHKGEITGEKKQAFRNILIIGIGGSSLGPRFVRSALASPRDKMKSFFIDNTDPDGIDYVLGEIGATLDSTLCIVISKSGGTIEPRNGMLEVKACYQELGLSFAKHAVAVTQVGSRLAETSHNENWLKAFPMWDWVGGRTSVLSSVGLLPLALQGMDIINLLQGAKDCDERTRGTDTPRNPGALLALMWYYATQDQRGKQMVVLPYKDRLELFAKYLQQLIMESLGKEKNLKGETVHQGIAVYGNKGSTDQHSYLQQLLEGPDNFFVTFIEVLKDREGTSPIMAENSTSGEYLQAFLLGTREALTEKRRESITITVKEINAYTIGVLIALFERAVSIYALLVGINAYHQPAVEMGKKVAGDAINLKNKILDFLKVHPGKTFSIPEIAQAIQEEEHQEMVFKILLHLTINPEHGVNLEQGHPLPETRFFVDG
ncbi:glucose-6-phosphate isomerase [Desulfitobacterium dichloroeliminans LMG P-21439]|uniref:Glucose-6-phosphate isomerase n=1 Tax=Desulfitobacterium dichloroeliminans (strain LMG P-21439 / DCA1) TaxID=871963 RepID=L0FAG4_DESDL|nr:glucose-6-phosphate isomerase [Desulfitobacterium dichloroeliminans]AGA69641.1 glucose-6-phosphate isomerase [Desulfitobacterium dichloroeliminans LMG P-21439]